MDLLVKYLPIKTAISSKFAFCEEMARRLISTSVWCVFVVRNFASDRGFFISHLFNCLL
jgi:hypothetical protein